MNVLYIVYVKTDESSNIIDVNSSAFLQDTTGWTQIDEGDGDKYHHAQGNYFDKPIITEKGVYRYKIIDGVPIEKTPEQILAEETALPPPPPTDSERLDAIESALLGVLLGI